MRIVILCLLIARTCLGAEQVDLSIQKLFGCTDGSVCKVGLKSYHNKYVAAEVDGKANADRDWMLAHETFSVTFIGSIGIMLYTTSQWPPLDLLAG